MNATFVVELPALDYPPPIERRVKLWRDMIRAKVAIAPIKVRKSARLPPDKWRVVSGAEAVEAAKREGITALDAVVF
jgi:hypothetical protein